MAGEPGGGGRLSRLWLAPPALGAAALAAVRFFQPDEMVFVRCAWLVGGGALPYRDFFDHHTPLFYALLAPAIALAPESPAALWVGRAASLALLAAVAALAGVIARRLGAADGALVAVLMLVTLPDFVARGIEIRPDLLATLAFLAAGAVLLAPGEPGPRRAAAAGLAAAVALLSTQKAAYYLWGLVLLAVADVVLRRRVGGRLLGPPWAFGAGLAAPLAAFAAYLAATGSLAAFWEQNVSLALAWQETERSFPAGEYLAPALARAPHWFLAVAAGALIAARRGAETAGVAVDGRRWPVYLALAGPAVCSLLVNPIPWPYNFLPVFAVLAPLAAFVPAAAPPGHRRRVLTLALALVAVGAYGLWLAGELARGNAGQRRDLEQVLALTRPDEPVFDDNGGYLFRPAAYRFWYHSSAMRALLRDVMAREIPAAILARGAPAWLYDFRFSDLPSEVQSFLQWHYQRYDGALFLWGSAYEAPAGEAGTTEFAFRAVRDGDYFLEPREPLPPGATIEVDGRALAPRTPVRLAAGSHRVTLERDVAGPAAGFFLLWVPANGELWRPLGGRPVDYYPWFF